MNAIDLSIVPVIDLSLSMNHLAMCHAIGLGCVVAAKSKVRHRVMVMDHTPTWIILDDMEFVDMVKTIVGASAMRTARNVQGVFDFFDAHRVCKFHEFREIALEILLHRHQLKRNNIPLN